MQKSELKAKLERMNEDQLLAFIQENAASVIKGIIKREKANGHTDEELSDVREALVKLLGE